MALVSGAGDALRSYSAEFARRRQRPRGGGAVAWPAPTPQAPPQATSQVTPRATPKAPWQQSGLLSLLRQRRRGDEARAAPEWPHEAGLRRETLEARLAPELRTAALSASRRAMPRFLRSPPGPGSAPQLARGRALAHEVGSVRSLSPPPPPPPPPLPDGLDSAHLEPVERSLEYGLQRRLQKEHPQQPLRKQQPPSQPPPQPPPPQPVQQQPKQPQQPHQRQCVVEPPSRWGAESQLTGEIYASARAPSNASRATSSSHGVGYGAARRSTAPVPGAYAARIASTAASARSAKDARGSQMLAPRIAELETELAAQRQAAQRLQSINARLQERLMQFHEQNSANVALARQRIGELEDALQRAEAAAEAAQRLRERDITRRRPKSSTLQPQPPPRQQQEQQEQQQQQKRSAKASAAAKALARNSEDQEQRPPQEWQPQFKQQLQKQQQRAPHSLLKMSFGVVPDAHSREELVERELHDLRARFSARSAARRARESMQRALRVWACAVLLSKLYAGARARRAAQCQLRCLAAWRRATAVLSATRAVAERRYVRERREAVQTIAREALHRWCVAARRDKQARIAAARERLASAFAGWRLAVHRRLRAENDRYRLELLLFPTPRGWNNAALTK